MQHTLKKTTHGDKYHMVFAGISEEVHLLSSYFQEKDRQIVVSGSFSNEQSGSPDYLGKISEIEAFWKENRVDIVICSVDRIDRNEYVWLADLCEIKNIQLYVIPDKNYTPNQHHKSIIINNVLLFKLLKSPLDKRFNAFIKRVFDIFFSVFICVFILSWLFPILALLIKLESKGPVFFIQKRNGMNNKPFNCIKFRTLYVNDESDTRQVSQGDNRITKIGRFLRKTSLDEFPQFLNVLTGSMSTVGPRPHMVKHNEYYNDLIDKYVFRHYVKPGITGLAQVLGYRGATESDIYLMKMRVRLDRFYIYNWSFLLDLKIIFKTFFEVFLPKKNTF